MAEQVKIFMALLIVITLGLSGCGQSTSSTSGTDTGKSDTTKTENGQTGTAKADTIGVTEADTGGQVRLQPGMTLEVTLISNPSTGYHWNVATIDPTCLQQTGEPVYTPDAGTEGLVGSGGKESFRFRAVAAGESQLKMNYLSPANQPSNTAFSITVNVQE